MPSTISGGGYLPYGYLGVDVFFVVGGYLLIGGLKRRIEDNSFNYWPFLFRKIVRLWPLVIISSIAAFSIGYAIMLPDDYENLAESAIASSVFANNILQCITTKNYWNIVNLYKPLMHLWYVGVLMQAYVILPIVYLLFNRIFGKKGIAIGTIILTLLSFLLYLIPTFSMAWKFYYLPFRIFEITIGGLLVLWNPQCKKRKTVGWLCFLAMLVILCSRSELLSGSIMLLVTVFLTVLIIWASNGVELSEAENHVIQIGAWIGKRSYSIYIWHQVIVAFLFYAVFPKQTPLVLLLFLLISGVLSAASYQLVEVPLGKVIGSKRKEAVVIATTAVVTCVLCVVSFQVYSQAGVVRDVPELGIEKKNVHRNMHAEYCDRPYEWDKDFSSGKIKVLVIGNSYGRDWANILDEYDEKELLEVSYVYYTDENLLDRKDRVNDADYVFFAIGPEIDKTPPQILVDMVPERLWIIGNKKYGTSNGIIYSHKNSSTYYDQTAEVEQWMIDMNQEYRSAYGNHFIDLMEPLMHSDNRVSVFTDDCKFISQDCSHLTQAGAQYYARLIDFSEIFSEH